MQLISSAILFVAILYALAAVIATVLITAIWLGIAAFRIAAILWSFGRMIVLRPDASHASYVRGGAAADDARIYN